MVLTERFMERQSRGNRFIFQKFLLQNHASFCIVISIRKSIHAILVLLEPMGAKGPKFSSDDRVNSFIRAAGSASSLHCPAQGFPVPSFR